VRQRLVTRDAFEVVVAQLDADGLAHIAFALQVASHLLAQLREDRASAALSRTACRSRSKVVSRLMETGSLSVTTGRSVAAPGGFVHPRARGLAKVSISQPTSCAASSPMVRMRRRLSFSSALGPMPLILRQASGQIRRLQVSLVHDGNTVGFVELAGHLGDQLVGRHAYSSKSGRCFSEMLR
jgi:hypothetical protein